MREEEVDGDRRLEKWRPEKNRIKGVVIKRERRLTCVRKEREREGAEGSC